MTSHIPEKTVNPRSRSLWARLRPERERHPARFFHRRMVEGVRGTTLEVQVIAALPRLGEQIEAEVLDEIDRLEAFFSLYDADSEFNRWQETSERDVAVSPELAEVLAQAEMWRQRSEGAFNPAVEAISQGWKIGAQTGIVPEKSDLSRLSREIKGPLWSLDFGACRARRQTCHRASLHSIAKGFIVDRACLVARRDGVEDVLLNIGGDLRHAGPQGVTVGIANPFTLADNAPPAVKVRLCNASVATNGRAKRGFPIGDRWFSHVLDPRTRQSCCGET